ncbi:MAG: zinc-dependent metalloprotease [Segniliparus sp.]|uniref:zinc-dependent metalloprotease n=1 Tax=Segniliparus sp. TaxID=2804064 RepID=UPI003F362857
MSKPPFGFSPWEGADGPGEGGPFGRSSGFDPSDIGKLLSQLGETFSKLGQAASGGAQAPVVDYQAVLGGAKKAVAKHKAPAEERQKAVSEAVRLAELWLDEATGLPTGVHTMAAWSPADWLDNVIGSFQELCDPVIERMAGVWQDRLPQEATDILGPMLAMVSRLGGFAFGEQLASGLGEIAGEVLTATEIGIPLGPNGVAALVVDNVAEFSEGLVQPAQEVLVYLAAREAAHHRLFSHVSWLKPTMLAAFQGYARGIQVDLPDFESAAEELDLAALQDPERMRELFDPAKFELKPTEEQLQALARLEHLLALVEGWVRTVVTKALADRLPSTAALDETIRRRAGGAGSAEKTFATLLGLQLRPKKLNEATKLWLQVGDSVGVDTRDTLWDHPDLLPTQEELDHPAQVVDRLLVENDGPDPAAL